MDSDVVELEEQLAEARAQIEALQASAADAEARATTARAERDGLREQMTEAEAARDAALGRIGEIESEAEGLRGELRSAAVKYRAARLASDTDVPEELVPELGTIEEIDREFESAQRVVGQLREQLGRDAAAQARTVRVPAGSPARREADVSSLSSGEKIRLGLQRLDSGQ